MRSEAYNSLEDVVLDEHFPDVDLELRRGRHIGREDIDWFGFLVDAQYHLETFYRRFACELVQGGDAYFYLLPSGARLGRRHLSTAEMLVGQALALMRLDPATAESVGLVEVGQLTELLTNIVGKERLLKALNSRRGQVHDERVAEREVRGEIQKALRGLDRLGFVERLSDMEIALRAPLMRFAEPVRGLSDPEAALIALIECGEVVVEDKDVDADEEEADDLEMEVES